MKLVELLAWELKEWPEADREKGHIESMSQAGDLQVSYYSGLRQVWREDVNDWSGHDYVPRSRFTLPQLATDHATAIVTRADWQAEKARIAGEETWLRHCGRKCPVESGTLVDLKLRGGVIHRGKFCDNHAWIYTGKPFDVMYYRVSETAEQPAVVENVQAFNAQAELLYDPVAQGPLQWRDRIYELDTQLAELEATYQRQIGEIDGEREGLVGKLKAEGLALVEVVQPVEDMSDWRQWRIGDLAEVVSTSGFTQGKLSVGDVVPIIDIDEQDGTVKAAVSCWGDVGGNYKWHSRPAR